MTGHARSVSRQSSHTRVILMVCVHSQAHVLRRTRVSGGGVVAPQRPCCRNRLLAPSVAGVSMVVKVVLQVHKRVEFKVHWRAILV
jgi:hypothetical protein